MTEGHRLAVTRHPPATQMHPFIRPPRAPARPPGTNRTRAERIQLRFLFLIATAVVTGLIGFGALEGALRVIAVLRPPEKQIAIPAEWDHRPVSVPGAVRAEYWHGHLHVKNADGMRIAGRYGKKPPGVYRVLAVGDSLTYGEGVAADEAWPAVLERELGAGVEVLNLGVCGAGSESIAELVRQQFEPAECVYSTLPRLLRIRTGAPVGPVRQCQRFDLSPDLIVYGMCLNDFVPPDDGSAVPPYTVYFPGKDWLIAHTLAGPVIAQRFDRALVALGLRPGFQEQIEAGGKAYRDRFGAEMRAMSRSVARHHLPPIISMVLTQTPGPSKLVEAAEHEMRAARMDVIPCGYCVTDAGQHWAVSRWEGHPNAHAHRVFAAAFANAIRARLPAAEGSPRPPHG